MYSRTHARTPPEDTGAARTDATHGNSETRHITARLRFVSSEDPSLSCLIITCNVAQRRQGVKPGRPTKSVTSDEKTRRGTHALGPWRDPRPPRPGRPLTRRVRSPGRVCCVADRRKTSTDHVAEKCRPRSPRLTTCELRSMPQADQRNFTRVCPHTTVRAVTTPHAIRHSHDVRLNAAGSTAGQHIRPPPPHAVHSGASMVLGKNRLGRA